MRNILVVAGAVLLLFLSVWGCGSSTSTIDQITGRVNRNKCRINRECLIIQIEDLEYHMDTTFAGIPLDLLADSLVACPESLQPYTLSADGNDRMITCPSGHGESSF
ncbi:MAG: hypothetical protein KAH54_01520 [Candidatus Sabulitectum sp.]|nr:hypothetical protein [Candidatus Sabulitectum sp.]